MSRQIRQLDENEQQLFLFGPDEFEPRYTNSIELYDLLPRIFQGRENRADGKHLETLEVPFQYHGRTYFCIIKPARVCRKDGYIDCYPKLREFRVEQALRKIAVDGNLVGLDGGERVQAGVVFSLYQVQQELARTRHKYSIKSIREAIEILDGCILKIQDSLSASANHFYSGKMINIVGLISRSDWQEHGKAKRGIVSFHPLVTQSILDRTFRQMNYERLMSYSTVVATYLHVRMSHYFKQAAVNEPYNILLSTIMTQTHMAEYEAGRWRNLRQIEKSLQQMIDSGMIWKYEIPEEDLVFKGKERVRRDLVDARILLYPSHLFQAEAKRANAKQRELRRIVIKNGKTLTPPQREDFADRFEFVAAREKHGKAEDEAEVKSMKLKDPLRKDV